MPFGLTNAGASFCQLMEMCIGNQQYITLLFCLDDICVLAETADQMLDRIQLVFNRLKEFSLKIKPKKSHFFQAEVDFLGHVFPKMGCHPIPIKLKKSMTGPHQQVPRKSILSLDWLPIIIGSFRTSRNGLGLYTHLSSQLLHNIRSERYSLKSDLPEFKWTEECKIGFNNLKQALIDINVFYLNIRSDTRIPGLL